jgi:hypothetical protein
MDILDQMIVVGLPYAQCMDKLTRFLRGTNSVYSEVQLLDDFRHLRHSHCSKNVRLRYSNCPCGDDTQLRNCPFTRREAQFATIMNKIHLYLGHNQSAELREIQDKFDGTESKTNQFTMDIEIGADADEEKKEEPANNAPNSLSAEDARLKFGDLDFGECFELWGDIKPAHNSVEEELQSNTYAPVNKLKLDYLRAEAQRLAAMDIAKRHNLTARDILFESVHR